MDVARRQLATAGAAGLSLRAIARELGMVSSAIYRYVASRDDLLTLLIVDGYNAVGEAVERADAEACAEGNADDFAGRWLAVCRAVREWALAHPHEYALLYGSPVPGYQAPTDTVSPATRDKVVFSRIVAEAYAAGAVRPGEADLPPVSPTLVESLDRVRDAVGLDVPDDVIARALTAWAGLYGTVSFELFGQFNNVIDERADYFDHTVTLLGRLVGLVGLPGPGGRSVTNVTDGK